MNAEVKEQWLIALRSGRYEQGTGTLRRVIGERTEYCCLGVLCEVVREMGLVEPVIVERTNERWDTDGQEFAPCYTYEYDNSSAYVPVSVARAAGLNLDPEQGSAVDPYVNIRLADSDLDEGVSLSSLNDSYEWNFEQIADAIERHL